MPARSPTPRRRGRRAEPGACAGPLRRRACRQRQVPPTDAAAAVKKYLIAGLLVWLPLAITIWVLPAALGLLDGVFTWLLDGTQAVLPEGATRSSSCCAGSPAWACW